jgi:hypothetical protein
VRAPDGYTLRLPGDLTQEDHVPGLPFGTRGGTRFQHAFSRDGTYEIRVRLTRDRNEEVEGLNAEHDLIVLLDGEQVAEFTVKPLKGADDTLVDAHLHCRIPVSAGVHAIGATFRRRGTSLEETARQPFQAHFNAHRHPRRTPAVFQVSLTGPFDDRGPGDSPSRARIFTTMPAADADVATQRAAALANLRPLLRRAYRREATPEEEARILAFYDEAQAERGFEAGIAAALEAVLVSRAFLLRVERQSADLVTGAVQAVDDHDLASRLSFFLWSSIPDDDLLDAAARGELRQPAGLVAQARRLLADPRAQSLITSFADQWLHLRNLEAFTPDARLFPDFDDNLRQAMRRETELLVEEVLRADRSVFDLIVADHTYLNERLARHYGIPHVYGPHFRRVALTGHRQRGGVLRHASVLTVTSYATRTAPTIRGKWVLETILGLPPPPPAPDVPALDDNAVSEALPVRERLARHRADPTCASCHDVIDPVGFAFEHYDALGRWRDHEAGHAIDARGALPDGSPVAGVPGVEQGVVQRPELFATALAERLLVYALGRGLDHHDAPAVRAIVRHAATQGYRFSAFVTGIVTSVPFRLRGTHG